MINIADHAQNLNNKYVALHYYTTLKFAKIKTWKTH